MMGNAIVIICLYDVLIFKVFQKLPIFTINIEFFKTNILFTKAVA